MEKKKTSTRAEAPVNFNLGKSDGRGTPWPKLDNASLKFRGQEKPPFWGSVEKITWVRQNPKIRTAEQFALMFVLADGGSDSPDYFVPDPINLSRQARMTPGRTVKVLLRLLDADLLEHHPNGVWRLNFVEEQKWSATREGDG